MNEVSSDRTEASYGGLGSPCAVPLMSCLTSLWDDRDESFRDERSAGSRSLRTGLARLGPPPGRYEAGEARKPVRLAPGDAPDCREAVRGDLGETGAAGPRVADGFDAVSSHALCPRPSRRPG